MLANVDGKEEVVRMLLKVGTAVDAADSGGCTALMLAARHGQEGGRCARC